MVYRARLWATWTVGNEAPSRQVVYGKPLRVECVLWSSEVLTVPEAPYSPCGFKHKQVIELLNIIISYNININKEE